jgi:hypothetical protein
MGESMTYDEMVEHLYDLSRTELRRLAYEALLISDGPARIEGDVTDAAIEVVPQEPERNVRLFTIWERR